MTTAPQNTFHGKILSLVLAEDFWQGDAYAIVRIDGQIAFSGTVQAPNSGPGTRIDLGAYDPTVTHAIDVEFTNDAWGGTADTDRNLYVQDVLVDGASTGIAASLFSAGIASFTVLASPPPPPAPATIEVGQGSDTVSFTLSEDAWDGDARFVVLVDGQQVGGEFQASALRSAGLSQVVTLRGDFSATPHQVGIRFLNDAYGGSADTDRNLYVDAVAFNGKDLGMSQALFSAGDATFQVGRGNATQTFGQGSDELRITANGDSWQGGAVMTVSVDGVQVGPALEVDATRASGQVQDFVLKGNFGPGAHSIAVTLTNDAWGGTADTDRNLFVHAITLNGTPIPASQADMFSAGTFSVTASIPGAPPNEPPPPPTSGGANANVSLVPVGAPSYAAGARVLTVGADKQFQTIAAAINASQDGDVVLVDAGTYVNDFAVVNSRISLLAAGGRVTMRADLPPPNWKGILTVETDLRVEGFTFTGAHIPDEYGHNAAGIRQEGGNLVLFNDEFTNNQNGILNGNANGGPCSITIDHSLFNGNGGADGSGAGNIHNIYIGNLDFATVTNSVFENALVGHEFKSRALVNTLTNNVFISGVGLGTGSYDIDLPNGGKATLTGNTIIKGPGTENRNMVHYGGEGIPYAGSSLTVTGNLFTSTVDGAVGVLNQTAVSARISGNVLDGLPADAFVQGPAKLSDNAFSSGDMLPDASLVGVLPGSTLIITDSDDHNEVVSGGKLSAVQGGAGHLTLDIAAGHVVIIGGTGGTDLTEQPGTGGSQYTTAAGSTNTLRLFGVGGDTIDSEGNDTIVAGDGNQSAQLNGNATVIAGLGSSTWIVNGAATIEQHQGSNFISLSADATLALTGTSTFFRIDSNGGQASWTMMLGNTPLQGSITGGAATMQAYDGALRLTTSGGPTGAVIHLDHGDANIHSVGADTIYAGDGNVTTILSGASKVYAGTGQLAIFGRGNTAGADIYGNGGRYLIDGDSGNITYHGGDLASTIDANLSSITLQGGNGLLTINGSGRNTVTGGLGGIALHAFGGGANTISTMAGSTNLLEISGSNGVTSRGNDTIIHDQGNTNIAVYGNSILQIGTGNSYLMLAGQDAVTSIGGYCGVTVTAGANVTYDSNATANIQADHATVRATVAASAQSPGHAVTAPASVTVSGTAFGLSLADDQGIAVSTAVSGTSSITASGAIRIDSGGADSIVLGDGSASIRLTGNGADIQAGSGQVDVYGDWSASAFTLHGGSGAINVAQIATTMRFVGGTGSAILSGGQMDIVGGSGSLQVSSARLTSFVGGSGVADIELDNSGSLLTFGSGAATVRQMDWGATNTYSFADANHGREIIQGFRAGFDIAATGLGVSIAAQDTAGGSAHFVLSNGADVTFLGLQDTHGIFS